MNSSDTNLETKSTEINNLKKSNKGLIVILILIILGLGSYIIYDKMIMKEKINKVSEKDENKKENYQNDTLKNDAFEKISQELYKKIIVKNDQEDYIFLSKNHLNHDALSNRIKFYVVINDDELLTTNYNSEYIGDAGCPYYDDQEYNSEDCIKYKIPKSTFEKKYKKLFGEDKDILYQNDIDWGSLTNLCNEKSQLLFLESGDYIGGYNWPCGDTWDGTLDFIQYSNAKYDGEDIIITIKFLRYNAFTNNGIYADPDETIKIENNIAQEFEDKIKHQKVKNSEMFNIYGDKAGTFEVRFKKDTNSNYYWYESKLIN